MSHALPSDWLKWLSDPYAVLGVSVVADQQRILKRYRAVAKILHPDRYLNADQKTRDQTTQLLARLVNPAYAKIKDESGRKEVSALLRLQTRRLLKEGQPIARCDVARELMRLSVQTADIFYEQKVAELAEQQFQSPTQFGLLAPQLIELNLVYFQLKQGDGILREQRSGLIAQPTQPITQQRSALNLEEQDFPRHNYATRHYDRAKQYAQKGSWKEAIQELRDAIRIDPTHSEFHALMGYVYLRQDQRSMAKVYFKQALKLNPQDPLAQRFADKVQLQETPPSSKAPDPKPEARRGLFGLFRGAKES